ncbi:B12-binding domain-containing radical SAM protein [Brenneria alni]|nr:radical SAM protein [Brenneria alni]
MIIYLVNAPNDPTMSKIANEQCFPALNMLVLGTWLKKRIPEFEVICSDGGIVGEEEILSDIKRLKPWFVGISVLAPTYAPALRIASEAKKIGAYTTFGNDQASQLSYKILQYRKEVDFVLGAEYGEYPLEKLIRKLAYDDCNFSDIPSLTWRNANGDITGFNYDTDKHKLGILNHELLGDRDRDNALDIFPATNRLLYSEGIWSTALNNYKKSFGHLHHGALPSGITTMNRVRGCSRANEKIKCKHCDMLLDISFSSPHRFWEEVKLANQQIHAELFYEVCDSLTSFASYMRKLVNFRPYDLGFDPYFFIYGQALDIVRNEELVSTLKKLNVFKMNIGLESGSNHTLKMMKGKRDSVDVNYAALRKLKKTGIYVYGSFVLGTEFETESTLRETIEWIKKIIQEGIISDIEIQPILPTPQNYYGKRMISDGLKFSENDWPFNVDEISREYIEKYCPVDYDTIIDAAKEVRHEASHYKLNFGSAVSGQEKYMK